MIRMFKDRIFNISILISLTSHIFWLSIITVIVTPKETEPIKFSKISFLGPILERGALNVRIEPRERSLLEKRYLDNIEKLFNYPAYQKGRYMRDVYIIKETGLTNLIEDAVSGPKMEPVFNEEAI